MAISGTQKISLENGTLVEARETFDSFLQGTISRMKEKSIEDADVTLKLKVKMTTADIYDSDEKIYIPKFDYKVTTSYQEKAECSGSCGGADYELVDMRDGSFGMRIAQDGQMTMEFEDE